jgi:hypothetical protein
MNDAAQVRELIAMAGEAIRYLRAYFNENGRYNLSVAENIMAAAEAIARSLSCGPLPVLNISVFEEGGSEADAELERIGEWLAVAEGIALRNSKDFTVEYPVDYEYLLIIHELSRSSYGEVLSKIKDKFLSLPEKPKNAIEEYLKKYRFWGTLDRSRGDFNFLENRAKTLHGHWPDLMWLYSNLSDYRSRQTLYALIKNCYGYSVIFQSVV